MKLEGFFAELNFSTSGAIKAIDDEMQRQLFRAWDAWLTEFIRIVPVWAGQSVGTVLPLAHLLQHPISIGAPRGKAKSDQSSRGASQSSATLEGGNGKWTIEYQTALKHLIINEFFDARIWGIHLKTPGPYNFEAQAKKAFLQVAAQAELPDLTQFFDFDKRSF